VPEKFRIGKWFLDRRPNSPNWCVCWYETETRQTRRASLGTSDLQEAQVRLAQHAIKHETLKDAQPDEVFLEKVLIRYYEQHAEQLPSAEQARHALGRWSDHFAGATVSELTPQRQEAFIFALQAKGYKPSYISRILSVGRAALNWAYKRQELVSAPFIMDVKRDPDEEAERFRELSMAEVARLLAAAARVPHLLRFCVISLNTLARPDAVLDLTPSQVDLDRRRINLNPKGRRQTKKYRPVVPSSKTLLPWLKDSEDERYVTHHGKPIASIKKSFANAVARAELTKVSPSCLRHTMATELRARGVPEWEIMGMMGHRANAARTTERYARFRPDYLGQAVLAIDDYFEEMRNEFGKLLPETILNPARASSVLVSKLGFPQSVEKDGGRHWDRTSDPYDVNVVLYR
jgi:integrase